MFTLTICTCLSLFRSLDARSHAQRETERGRLLITKSVHFQNGLLTLYASFPGQQGLSHNWKEPGLHYNGISSTLKPPNLLTVWPDNLHLPNDPIVLNAKGEVMGRLNLSHSVTKRTPYRSQR